MLEQKIEISDELITKEVTAFAEVTRECVALYAKKNHDYGNSFDKGMEGIGLAYGVGRIYDKCNRLVTLTKEKSVVKNESVEDTLKDLACYAIMMLAYRKREIENKQQMINFE